MCTLTYIPKNEKQFVFTSNRDESVSRPTSSQLVTENHQTIELTFPKDLEKGGSWIAISEDRFTCLLNGAEVKHQKLEKHTQSRGTVVLDSFLYPIDDFTKNYSFENIEPFTLIQKDFTDNRIVETLWTGSEIKINVYPATEAKIWSSVTLYSPEKREEKRVLFAQFITELKTLEPKEIIKFHRVERMILNLPEIATTSITQFNTLKKEPHLEYFSLH